MLKLLAAVKYFYFTKMNRCLLCRIAPQGCVGIPKKDQSMTGSRPYLPIEPFQCQASLKTHVPRTVFWGKCSECSGKRKWKIDTMSPRSRVYFVTHSHGSFLHVCLVNSTSSFSPLQAMFLTLACPYEAPAIKILNKMLWTRSCYWNGTPRECPQFPES